MELYNYKGYRYYLGDTKYTIFDRHGMTVKSDEIRSEAMHSKVQAIIDEMDAKTPKVAIKLVRTGDTCFDVYDDKKGIYLGWFRTFPNDWFQCFKAGEMYAYSKERGLKAMMDYFRKISEEAK